MEKKVAKRQTNKHRHDHTFDQMWQAQNQRAKKNQANNIRIFS